MKKLINSLSLSTMAIMCSGDVMAQQQVKDTKPKIAEAVVTTETGNSSFPNIEPQNIAKPKALTLTEQPKHIIPGGEFVPR